MRIVTFALLVLFLVPTWASQPGRPLDCSDWVVDSPGLSCRVFAVQRVLGGDCEMPGGRSLPCSFPTADWAFFDNEGRLIGVETEVYSQCGFRPMMRYSIRDLKTGASLAQIDERCVESATSTADMIQFNGFTFDAHGGVLLVALRDWCHSFSDCPGYLDPSESAAIEWIMELSPFSTTFDLLQTYTPTNNAISFRVPYMPEGFQYADYFDTYWGDLETVGDWSQAQPLQCGYPATAPSVGDYLTVEDTLPTLAPGQGYYYVTAVNYQGQRRYGRQSNDVVLTGRDPGVLPMCERQ